MKKSMICFAVALTSLLLASCTKSNPSTPGEVTVLQLQQQLVSQQTQLTNYRAQVKAYLMNHKLAVAAIVVGAGGAKVALSSNNEFSKDAKKVGAVASAIAAIYALTHMKEVREVFKQLKIADSNVKLLKSRINETSMRISAKSNRYPQGGMLKSWD